MRWRCWVRCRGVSSVTWTRTRDTATRWRAAKTQTRLRDSRQGAAGAPGPPRRAALPATQRRQSGGASLASTAARAYRGCPQSSHAMHMPAHIFLQLGHVERRRGSDRDAFGFGGVGRGKGCRRLCAATTRCRGSSTSSSSSDDSASVRTRSTRSARWSRRADRLTLAERPLLDACDATSSRRAAGTSWPTSATSATSTSCARSASAPPAGECAAGGAGAPGARRRARTSPQEGNLRPAIAIMEREVAALIAFAAGRAGTRR